MKNHYCILAVVIILAGISSCTYQKDKEKARPNIIVFLADDLGYADLGCYGNQIIKTPNIDQLAIEGVRLTDFHSGGTVCSPSRAALLTGRNPYRSGFYYILGGDTFLADDELTIAEVLKTAGYETFFAGKWHLSILEKDRKDQPGPGEQGFDYWMGTTHNAFDGPANTKSFIRNGNPVGQVDGWFCDVIVEEAKTWLKEKRDKSKPFFMYICSHEPHTPVAPPEEFSNQYIGRKVDSLEQEVRYGGVNRPEKDISSNKKEYYGTVAQLDNAFGNLLNTLKELGLEENTLVMFTSDNGPETPVTLEESRGEWEDPIRDNCFGTPGIFRGMKRYPYEGGHRVPGIVRYPGVIPAASISDKLFNGTDILPTLSELAGTKIITEKTIDGEDNFNAFMNKSIKRKIPAIWFYPNHGDTWFRMPQVSMRSGNYSLIGWLPEKPDTVPVGSWFFNQVPVGYELYDLKKDPQQLYNIAGDNPELLNEMVPLMNKYWIEMRDEGHK